MRKKISFFFTVLKKTLTSTSYYRDILAAPFSFSFKFFLVFSVLISLIINIYIFNKFIWAVPNVIKVMIPAVTDIYPEEIEIKINKGKISTNVAEPYTITMANVTQRLNPDAKKSIDTEFGSNKNLLVIDTKGSIEDFTAYDTRFLLTSNYLMFARRAAQVEIVSLKNAQDMVINKSFVEKIIKQFVPILRQVIYFGAIFLFIAMILINILSTLVYLIFFALLLWLLAKIINYSLAYKKSFQMGLHLSVFSMLIFSTIDTLSLPIHFPFLRSLVLLSISLYILTQIKPAMRHK